MKVQIKSENTTINEACHKRLIEICQETPYNFYKEPTDIIDTAGALVVFKDYLGVYRLYVFLGFLEVSDYFSNGKKDERFIYEKLDMGDEIFYSKGLEKTMRHILSIPVIGATKYEWEDIESVICIE